MNHSIRLLTAIAIAASALGAAPASALTEWEEFCLMTSDPGKDIDECLTWGEVGQGRKDDGKTTLTIRK